MNKILIVGDDFNISELINVFLRNEGFDINKAFDVVEAISKLEIINVDMVVLAIMMLNMDCWQLCRELREYYDLSLLMIIAKGKQV